MAKRPNRYVQIMQAIFLQYYFEQNGDDTAVSAERHYRLVKPDELSVEELINYRSRPL